MDDAIHCIHDLWSIGFTLDKLDNELASMILIQALPDNYNLFVSSLLLKDDLDSEGGSVEPERWAQFVDPIGVQKSVLPSRIPYVL